MANEATNEFATDLRATIRERMQQIAQTQKQWARITATGSAVGKRVTVVVNAEGVVIETRFTADADQLGLTELARAVTTAAQEAAAAAKKQAAELMAPLQASAQDMPKVSDYLPELPDLDEHFPKPPEVSTAPPDSPDRAEQRQTAAPKPGQEGHFEVFDGRGR